MPKYKKITIFWKIQGPKSIIVPLIIAILYVLLKFFWAFKIVISDMMVANMMA